MRLGAKPPFIKEKENSINLMGPGEMETQLAVPVAGRRDRNFLSAVLASARE